MTYSEKSWIQHEGRPYGWILQTGFESRKYRPDTVDWGSPWTHWIASPNHYCEPQRTFFVEEGPVRLAGPFTTFQLAKAAYEILFGDEL